MKTDLARTTVGRQAFVVLEEQGLATFASPKRGRTLRVQLMLRAVILNPLGRAEDVLKFVEATSRRKAARLRRKLIIIAGLD